MLSSTIPQSMQPMQHCDSSHRSLYIEQWRRAVALHSESQSAADTAYSPGAPPSKRKRRDYDTALPAMPSPPTSDRSQSPSKRIKLSHRSRDDDDDDPFLAGAADARLDPDPDQTPRRNTTAGIISNAPQLTLQPPQSVASSASGASAASRTTASTTTSRGRSTSPTKKTQRLIALRKPIHHVQIDDNKTDQLPEDIRDLYNRLYDITGYHDGIAPWEVRNEINASVAHKFREAWFRNRTGTKTYALGDASAADERHRDLALGELVALRKIQRKAKSCRELGRSEAAWNMEVHGPLLELALEGHAHVQRELVTTAQITKPFVPPMSDLSLAEFTDKKMVDFVMVLVPKPDDEGEGLVKGLGDGAQGERFRRLAYAVHNTVLSQPLDRQSINQTLYPPLIERPIGISIETKADGANEVGRVQLAIWTAAWHERMMALIAAAGKLDANTRLVTMPLLLIVEHSWLLSFVCDRGDRLEVVGDMMLGETADLKGLYTIVTALRELADWMEGPFAEWIAGVLDGGVGG